MRYLSRIFGRSSYGGIPHAAPVQSVGKQSESTQPQYTSDATHVAQSDAALYARRGIETCLRFG